MSIKGKVVIDRLELHAYHGWHKHEGEFGQPYTIEANLDSFKAAWQAAEAG